MDNYIHLLFFLFCRETVELCRRAEAAGCGWITVHGRTTKQRAEPCNMEAIKIVRQCTVKYIVTPIAFVG